MPPTNPLEVQEIGDLVATYLEGKDLASCVCVSKSWQNTFLPHRWRFVRLELMKGEFPVHFGPNRVDIYHHRYLVQDLSLIGETDGVHAYQYPNLRRLEIYMLHYKRLEKYDSMDLTEGTPLLVELELTAVETAPGFWETLSKHRHLRNLKLRGITVEADDTPGFWETGMNLVSLRTSELYFNEGSRPRNMIFDRLRELSMTGFDLELDAWQLDLVLQSPLDSLEWEITDLIGISILARNGEWPPIKRLHLDCDAEDTDWAFMLNGGGNGLGNIVDLRTHGCRFDMEASRALSIHFSTLVKVELMNYGMNGYPPLDVLCFCPRLEVLKVLDVLADDIAERGPWACQQLRELTIYFRFYSLDQDLEQLVFERLSTLSQLEQLTIGYPFPERTCLRERFEFQLDYGLGQLATLQQLTHLCFNTERNQVCCPEIGMNDVRWMVDNWKKLKSVKGRLNSDKEVGGQLVSVFESHGIAVTQ